MHVAHAPDERTLQLLSCVAELLEFVYSFRMDKFQTESSQLQFADIFGKKPVSS